ncbi:hypothetical protein C7437_104149 [Psychrobacillus insolitus]|uniref:Uncharacterized protein n=1 Tax=Psychrobacillus insolitus TaxID=1461 RepID=A0A2W7ML60_9BACI|nr:hypothetical protein [Psychrobacillus insolitus]PZX04637.1 hypothetical protein C7437_104149 [Psychrobacillus insolitus]
MKKIGVVLMFIGAVMLATFMFVDLKVDFGLWITGFLISMIVAASGAVTLIFYLAKGIKADKASNNDFK